MAYIIYNLYGSRTNKIKGCRNGRDYFSMGIVSASGWSFVNEEQALRAWALSLSDKGQSVLQHKCVFSWFRKGARQSTE